jgi:AraC-like DNA-binding protein
MIITNNGQLINQDIKSEFPVRIKRAEYHELGPTLKSHWHEEFMIFYIEQGKAIIHCNSQPIPVCAGDLIIINSNDVHYVENLCSYLVEYHFIIDLSFLLSKQEDLCQTEYIGPIMQQHIRFENQIKNDNELLYQVLELIHEYKRQDRGYELLIKAGLYRILVLLMRRHTAATADKEENEQRYHTLHQLRPVLKYVDQHYTQKLTLTELATMSNMSRHHFCRLFKSITGKPPIEYINYLRINVAMGLLKEGQLNISEIAMTVGFNDSNYFSRLFKKYKNCSPTCIKKRQQA